MDEMSSLRAVRMCTCGGLAIKVPGERGGQTVCAHRAGDQSGTISCCRKVGVRERSRCQVEGRKTGQGIGECLCLRMGVAYHRRREPWIGPRQQTRCARCGQRSGRRGCPGHWVRRLPEETAAGTRDKQGRFRFCKLPWRSMALPLSVTRRVPGKDIRGQDVSRVKPLQQRIFASLRV